MVRKRIARIYLIAFVVATMFVLLGTTQDYLEAEMSYGKDVEFFRMLWWPSIWWYSWAMVAPFFFELGWRYPFSGSTWKKSTLMLILGGIVAYFSHWSVEVIAMSTPYFNMVHSSIGDAMLDHFLSGILINNLVFVTIVLAAQATRVYYDAQQERLKAATLEAELTSTRLEMLKMQLHPHFLFNALNSISTLMHRDTELADAMLGKLSSLVREALERSGKSWTTIERELEFLSAYLDIERIRFGDNIGFETHVEENVKSCIVPSFLFQPLVENAIKHGFSGGSLGGTIVLSCRNKNGAVHLRVEDDGCGSGEEALEYSTGVGLSNLLERLSKLYGEECSMNFGPLEENGFRVDITLPCKISPPVEAGP